MVWTTHALDCSTWATTKIPQSPSVSPKISSKGTTTTTTTTTTATAKQLYSERIINFSVCLCICLVCRFPRIHFTTNLDDAHCYIFQRWIIDFLLARDDITSVRVSQTQRGERKRERERGERLCVCASVRICLLFSVSQCVCSMSLCRIW